jgi:Protein of unknown function (DUF3467)
MLSPRGRGGSLAGDEEAQLRISGIRFPDYLRPTYANFINVNHTPWDFRVTFAVLKTPVLGTEMEQAQQGEVMVTQPEAVADLIIPANLVHGFISALRENFDRYIDAFGAPGINPEGPEQRE